MADRTTPTSSAHSATAPEVVTVRALRFDDLIGVTAGEEPVLYQLRSHARVLSLDRGEIGATSLEELDSVGSKHSVAVRTAYGAERTADFYSSAEAFDADFPPGREGTARAAARERALSEQADPGIYVEDPDGPLTLPVTPDWGSQASVSVLVPDLDPDALATAIEKVLDEQFPGHRRVELQTRWVADRRVNVYRPDFRRDGGEEGVAPGRAPLEANVHEAEAVGLLSVLRVEQVPPEPPPPAAPAVGRAGRR